MTLPASINLDPGLRGLAGDCVPTTRLGSLQTRLAATPAEIRLAQRLRHDIFRAGRGRHMTDGLDADHLDEACDHLLILDTALQGGIDGQLVGAARLISEDGARRAGGFYSESEFTLRSLRERQPGKRFLELGRTCILPSHRSKRTAELMWAGVWAHALETGADVLVGCASLPGTIPAAHALALSHMHHHHRATGAWRAKALPERRVSMDLMPVEAVGLKAAMAAMPPLLKGYLRLGAMIGDGCVIDADFGTVDVFVVLPVERITARYIRHYGATGERFAA
jgi:L-ornithine Nalpha-acyltransferase